MHLTSQLASLSLHALHAADGLGPGLGGIIMFIFVMIAVVGVLALVGVIAFVLWMIRRRRQGR
jgi:hypothetical protein